MTLPHIFINCCYYSNLTAIYMCIIFMNMKSEQFRFAVSSGFFMQQMIWKLYIYFSNSCHPPYTIHHIQWEMGVPRLSFCSNRSERNKLFIELECSARCGRSNQHGAGVFINYFQIIKENQGKRSDFQSTNLN